MNLQGFIVPRELAAMAGLSWNAKAAWAYLRDLGSFHAAQGREAYPGKASIARALDLSEKQLEKAVRDLVAAGLLTVEVRAGVTSVYRTNTQALQVPGPSGGPVPPGTDTQALQGEGVSTSRDRHPGPPGTPNELERTETNSSEVREREPSAPPLLNLSPRETRAALEEGYREVAGTRIPKVPDDAPVNRGQLDWLAAEATQRSPENPRAELVELGRALARSNAAAPWKLLLSKKSGGFGLLPVDAQTDPTDAAREQLLARIERTRLVVHGGNPRQREAARTEVAELRRQLAAMQRAS